MNIHVYQEAVLLGISMHLPHNAVLQEAVLLGISMHLPHNTVLHEGVRLDSGSVVNGQIYSEK